MFSLPTQTELTKNISLNWKAGLTVAFISVPLSIALSIASGAGPLPGLIAGIWGTLIGAIFIGSEYNIIGAAGALTTVLFAATLSAPLGLGASILPLLALFTGAIIGIVWLLKLDRYLYYIPSSVMYGFAAGVAILIAASQLFDATGLSRLARTGHFTGDIEKFLANTADVHAPSVAVFVIFLAGILTWKRSFKKIPAVIPAAVLGIVFGYLEANYFSLDIFSLQDKFGSITATLMLPVAWDGLRAIFADHEALKTVLGVSSIIALIAVLETLITAKLGDKLTKTESSSSRELFGLALSNIGSGAMGGLPTTGVFIRTGANIKAGATHRTSGVLAALFTGVIALAVLPFFSFIPMAVIAAILVNTALGLLEVEKFQEYWHHERESFGVAILVALVTIFHDAGLGVAIGAMVALFLFASKVSHGRFDVIWNFSDGTTKETRSCRTLDIPTEKKLAFVSYSIAGNIGYIDANRHFTNLKKLAQSNGAPVVILRFKNLFSIDFEGMEALVEAVNELQNKNVRVYISSTSSDIESEMTAFPVFKDLKEHGFFTGRTSDAIAKLKS
ncbi:MAG: SulP family inorganic anion transporter [Candidatus Pacebacteria bacterium]|nr:SulP family inorganic anion transporter [Candidatus Paceibacterota bacterium]